MAPARPGPIPARSVVGYSGAGTLTIQNGGTVSNDTAILGYYGSTGTVTVDGAGSSWTVPATLYVGDSGIGTLTIRNGGKVSNATIVYLGLLCRHRHRDG